MADGAIERGEFCRPCRGGGIAIVLNPWLTPWATVFRRSAAVEAGDQPKRRWVGGGPLITIDFTPFKLGKRMRNRFFMFHVFHVSRFQQSKEPPCGNALVSRFWSSCSSPASPE